MGIDCDDEERSEKEGRGALKMVREIPSFQSLIVFALSTTLLSCHCLLCVCTEPFRPMFVVSVIWLIKEILGGRRYEENVSHPTFKFMLRSYLPIVMYPSADNKMWHDK